MRRIALFATLGVLVACDGVLQPICACSPPGGGTAVITGTVRDSASTPVLGAAVRVRIMRDESCAEPDSTLTRTASSGVDGRFRHIEAWSGGRKCFRIWAEPPAGSGLGSSASQLVRIDFLETVRPDSVDLSLVLR